MSKQRKKKESWGKCVTTYMPKIVCGGGWVTVWVVRCQQRFVGVRGKYSSLLRADRIRSLKARHGVRNVGREEAGIQERERTLARNRSIGFVGTWRDTLSVCHTWSSYPLKPPFSSLSSVEKERETSRKST